MSVDSYAQFIYLCYALFLSLRRHENLLAAPFLFLLFLFICVSEPASVQTRPFYGECLIKAVLNAILQSPGYFLQCLIYSTLIILMKAMNR